MYQSWLKKLVFVPLLCLFGCTAMGPAFAPAPPPSADIALVYIYRGGGAAMRARTAEFYVNDVNVFDLDAEGYSWVRLPAGTYTLQQRWNFNLLLGGIMGGGDSIFLPRKTLQIHLNLKPGETRYLSFQTDVCPQAPYGMVCLEWRLAEQPQEVGQAEIQSEKFQENFGAARLLQQIGSR